MTASGRPPRKKETVRAAAAIVDALAWHGITDEVRAHRIVTQWSEIVGDRIAARSWPDGLRSRVLWVRVRSAPWLHELTLLKPQLDAAIRAAVGEPSLFDELRYHLGARPAEPDDLLAGVRQRIERGAPRRPPPVPATGERRVAIESETATVDDAELRALIRDVRVRNDR
jgi:hypothetical protein